MTRLPPVRRRPVRGEVVLTTGRKKRCGTHRLIQVELGRGETVVACGICGKPARGETLPVWLEPRLK